MLTIRLQRTGKKNQADFRIVVAEKEAPVNKKVTEIIGSYNPRSKKFQIKEERAKYWIAQRVEMSPTVHNLFVNNKLVEGTKVRAFNTPKKPSSVPTEVGTTAGKPAEAPKEEVKLAAAAETPAEVAEATAEMEVKVEQAIPEVVAEPVVEAPVETPAETPTETPAA